jgi:hypothetical protein
MSIIKIASHKNALSIHGVKLKKSGANDESILFNIVPAKDDWSQIKQDELYEYPGGEYPEGTMMDFIRVPREDSVIQYKILEF